jgi:hypothetical protein
VKQACEWLLRQQLVEADHMNSEKLEFHDSIKITASGFIHLRILCERLEYLYGILTVTPIFDRSKSGKIADYIDRENRHDRIGASQMADCVALFLGYMQQEYKRLSETYPGFGLANSGSAYVLSQIEGTIDHFKSPSRARTRINPLDR